MDDKKVEREERRSIIYGDLGAGCKIEREREMKVMERQKNCKSVSV